MFRTISFDFYNTQKISMKFIKFEDEAYIISTNNPDRGKKIQPSTLELIFKRTPSPTELTKL